MSGPGLRIPAAFLAAAAAGPLFVASHAAASLYLRLPAPVTIDGAEAMQLLAILLPAILIGGIVGFVPIVLGAAMMGALAERMEAARSPLAWAAAGALCGVALAFHFEVETDAFAFALVATSSVCALICHRQIV